jgi:hypothetical protein
MRRARPATVEFTGGRQVKVTLHAARLESAGDSFSNWDLAAAYELSVDEGRLTLRRVSDVEALPTSFDPLSGRRLSSRHVAVRSNLMNVFRQLSEQGDGFPDRIELPTPELRGDLSNIGSLWLDLAMSDQGWLTLGWHRRP